MNGMKLNLGTDTHSNVSGPMVWGDINHYVREGERQRAEYVAHAVFAALRQLRLWVGAQTSEARAQAQAERAARRLNASEIAGSPARGFFWPRLSWVAHEGKRWIGLLGAPKADGKDQRAA